METLTINKHTAYKHIVRPGAQLLMLAFVSIIALSFVCMVVLSATGAIVCAWEYFQDNPIIGRL